VIHMSNYFPGLSINALPQSIDESKSYFTHYRFSVFDVFFFL